VKKMLFLRSNLVHLIVSEKMRMSRLNIRITIGLCAKNAERTIRDCLKSISNQTYPKELINIIVVDGQSKDKTVEIAKQELLTSGIKSKILSDNGMGLGVARQAVVENTGNKYIIWVDADARVFEDFVQKQIEFMEKNPRVCVATGGYIRRKYAHAGLPASLESLGKCVGSLTYISAQGNRGIPPNDASIYRVKALKQVGGFDKNIRGASEDEDVISRMRKKGWVVKVNKRAKFYVVSRGTWQSVWTRYVWYGYGGHFLSHKTKDSHFLMYSIPLVHFFDGFRFGVKAYRLTSERESFLFPLRNVFLAVGRWYGYAKAHIEGYGH